MSDTSWHVSQTIGLQEQQTYKTNQWITPHSSLNIFSPQFLFQTKNLAMFQLNTYPRYSNNYMKSKNVNRPKYEDM